MKNKLWYLKFYIISTIVLLIFITILLKIIINDLTWIKSFWISLLINIFTLIYQLIGDKLCKIGLFEEKISNENTTVFDHMMRRH